MEFGVRSSYSSLPARERAAGLIPAVRRGPYGEDQPRRSLHGEANCANEKNSWVDT
jgi:hypothetical protein